MKNMYRVTRPAWATLENMETAMILVAGLLLGGIAQIKDQYLDKRALTGFSKFSSIVIELLIPVAVCLILIWWYKKQRVGCYPTTFVYCFILPRGSNQIDTSQVVGYCYVKPDMRKGEIKVEGASFSWENQRLTPHSRVRFKSTQVRGTEEDGEATCHIRFNIHKDDSAKRFYRHGLLQFRLASPGDRISEKGTDEYAGYMQSMQKDSEIQEIEVRSKGFAELHRKGIVDEDYIQVHLSRQGEVLFGKLRALLNSTSPPTLWQTKEEIHSDMKNVWGDKIPTAQSVILDPKLHPFIDALLNQMLGLYGLETDAIEQFKSFARATASPHEGGNLITYERELKRELIGLTVASKRDAALTHRAKVIFDEIKSFIIGDSLLDIGCGNGMISNEIKRHFKQLNIQLTDVIDYVPRGYNLAFQPYKAGDPLPFKEQFDTVLLLTVLHHALRPTDLLKLAWAATRKRLIIIESVVGIHQVHPHVNYELVDMPDSDQIGYAAFVDWFYNRVLHDNVPVPYNFTTPERWQSIFVENGMHLAQTIHFGQDIDIGPEYHVLFVLEKQQ